MSMLLDSKSKVNITLDIHWIIAPIEKAINTEVTELGKTGKEIFFKGKTKQ